MKQYIDKSAVVAEIERLQGFFVNERDGFEKGYHHVLRLLKSFLDTLEVKEVDFEREQEQPEPYFYCKYGGTIPLCSDCKRNHNNSPFKTEEITTWYAPSNGTKRCIDYIQQEQPEMDLEKEIDKIWNPRFNLGWDEKSLLSINHEGFTTIAKYFYELGRLNERKENKI